MATYKCGDCGMTFTEKLELEHHAVAHSEGYGAAEKGTTVENPTRPAGQEGPETLRKVSG